MATIDAVTLRARLGAIENRFGHTITSLTATMANTMASASASASASRIRDADRA
jgi:flagellin-like hook-associated protein FlgL